MVLNFLIGDQRRRGMLGIPYRVRIQRNDRRPPVSSSRTSREFLFRLVTATPAMNPATTATGVPSRDFRCFVSESGMGPPIIMRRMTGWTFGSKLMALTAGFILIAGIILTLLTMNSNLHLDAYRPVIFTILGILFIVIGPIVVCRMVLNAYDRRLMREQRQFENIARQIRRREAQTQADDSSAPLDESRQETRQETRQPSRAQLAIEFFLGTGRNPSRYRDSQGDWFPGSLPSYESALELNESVHWSSKFFDYQKAPPPSYQEAIEMETFRIEERRLAEGTTSRTQQPIQSVQPIQPIDPLPATPQSQNEPEQSSSQNTDQPPSSSPTSPPSTIERPTTE